MQVEVVCVNKFNCLVDIMDSRWKRNLKKEMIKEKLALQGINNFSIKKIPNTNISTVYVIIVHVLKCFFENNRIVGT
jgi:hypothetical protein